MKNCLASKTSVYTIEVPCQSLRTNHMISQARHLTKPKIKTVNCVTTNNRLYTCTDLVGPIL